jgi:hypothetical protein
MKYLSITAMATLYSSAAAATFAMNGGRSSALRAAAAATSRSTSTLSAHVTDGGAVPSVTFKTRTRVDSADNTDNPFDWKDVKSEELFKGKRAVIFSLPGAFTPTCSNTHLPGYENNYEEFKKLGVDEVYCLSVNDAFVMRQWGLHQGLTEDKTPELWDLRRLSSW